MSQDTKVNNLIINKLTEAQYKALVDTNNVSDTELYMTTDSDISVKSDDKTISKNTNNELQTIATIDKNDSTAIATFTGTTEEYEANSDDNTLFYITDDNEDEEAIISDLDLFDTKVTDHILQGTEAVGWGLQGSKFYKSDYPDAYARILSEYMSGAETTNDYLTYRLATNGHRVTTDKTGYDNIYNQFKAVQYYVLNEDEESVVLPKNDWFEQLTSDTSKVNVFNEKGASDSTIIQLNSLNKLLYYKLATTTVGKTIADLSNQEKLNIPYSFGDSKYSPVELNNVSWLKSSNQWNAKAVYPDYYDWLLKIQNGTETQAGVSVKLSTETYTDYDWVLNTADEKFRLPLLDGSEDLPGTSSEKTLPTTKGQQFIAEYNGIAQIYSVPSAANQYTVIANATTNEIDENRPPLAKVGCVVNVWVNKGDTYNVNGDVMANIIHHTFIKAKGNGTLYFYVGNTTQDKGIIQTAKIANTISNMKYVVETYKNENAWYRIWSDGWIEQGGVTSSGVASPVTVTLIKPFTSVAYTVVLTARVENNDGSALLARIATLRTTNTNNFIYSVNSPSDLSTVPVSYYACGY